MAREHEGGCQCGEIRYRVTGKPRNTTTCHCSKCRMAAGAPFLTLSEFSSDAVTFTAAPLKIYKSSDIAERGFCPTCGTALTFRFLGGDTIDIATATFDDPHAFPPEDHLWVDSKVAWVNINDGLPQYSRGRDDD